MARIVEVVPSLSVGGAERVAALCASGLRDLGHDVSVISLFSPCESWIEADLARSGIPVHHLGKAPGLDPRVWPRLARAFASLGPDAVHTHLHVLKYVLPARVAAPRARVVHTLHNLAEKEATGQDRAVQRLAFRLGVRAVAIGKAVAASFREIYGRPPDAVIPNGIPLPEAPLAPERQALRETVRAELALADTPLLLFAGRLNDQKNPGLLLDALHDPRLADAVVAIAGEGPLEPMLKQRIAAEGLVRRVRLLGLRHDLPRLFAAADLLVLPSHYEGNPLVVMEAMAGGLGVVATAVGCVPELIRPETGRLVPPANAKALADSLASVLADPSMPAGLGAAARRHAVAAFDARRMAEAYERVLAGPIPVIPLDSTAR